MADLRWHFVPDNGEGSVGVGTENEEDEGVGVEDEEEGGDGEENKDMRDTEMEESGADMTDNAMDETLH